MKRKSRQTTFKNNKYNKRKSDSKTLILYEDGMMPWILYISLNKNQKAVSQLWCSNLRNGAKVDDKEYVKLMNATSEELENQQTAKEKKQKRS